MGFLTRDDILSNGHSVLPRGEVAAFGGTVLVQGLTALEKDRLEASCWIQEGNQRRFDSVGLRGRWVVESVIDGTGRKVFQPGDTLRVCGLPSLEVDRIVEMAQRLSGDTPEIQKELEKNSTSGPHDASSSA